MPEFQALSINKEGFLKSFLSKNNLITILSLTFLLAFGALSTRQYIHVVNKNHKNVRLENGVTVSQEVNLKHTSKLAVNIHNNNINSNGTVVITLSNEDGLSETFETKLSEIETDDWNLVFAKPKKLRNGKVKLSITVKDIEPQTTVSIQTGNGTQIYPLPSNVQINGATEAERYLRFKYNYFDFVFILKVILISFISILVCFCIIYAIYYLCHERALVFLGLSLCVVQSVSQNVFTFTAQLGGWCTTPWFYHYKYGFISRALPGTVLSILSELFFGKDIIGVKKLRAFFILLLVILIFLCIFVIVTLLQKIKKNNPTIYEVAKKYAFLFILSPFFVTFYCANNKLGRLDLVLQIMFFLCCLIIATDKCLFLIPLFCSIAILSHQMFVFVMFPMIFSLMLYQLVIAKKKNYAVPTIAILIFSASFAFYCQFMGDIKGVDARTVIAEIYSRTVKESNEGLLCLNSEHYFSTSLYTNRFMHNFVNYCVLFKVVLTLIIMLPILIFYAKSLISTFKESNGYKKFIIFIITICPLGLFPILFTVAFDWGRWFTEWVTAIVIGMLVLCSFEKSPVVNSVKTTESQFSKVLSANWSYLIGAIYLLMGTMEDGGSLEFTRKIINFAKEIMLKID